MTEEKFFNDEEELSLEKFSDDDDFFEDEIENDFGLLPKDKKTKDSYIEILKGLLPHIGSNETKIIITEIMVALKLEGQLSNRFSPKEKQMVNIIKNAILAEPIRKHQAIKFAQKLLKDTK